MPKFNAIAFVCVRARVPTGVCVGIEILCAHRMVPRFCESMTVEFLPSQIPTMCVCLS